MTTGIPEQVLKGRHILIIEDDKFISKLYNRWLAMVGARVTVANDGALGLAALKKETADLILLDLGMPGLNGFDTLKLLRKEPATAHIPVIVLSNTAMNENRTGFEEIRNAGVTDILQKYEVSLKDIIMYVSRYFPKTESAERSNTTHHESGS